MDTISQPKTFDWRLDAIGTLGTAISEREERLIEATGDAAAYRAIALAALAALSAHQRTHQRLQEDHDRLRDQLCERVSLVVDADTV